MPNDPKCGACPTHESDGIKVHMSVNITLGIGGRGAVITDSVDLCETCVVAFLDRNKDTFPQLKHALKNRAQPQEQNERTELNGK